MASMLGMATAGQAMSVLSDEELSTVDGQALLNLHNSFSSDQGINFHKLSIQALMELNVNIKTLQLGCGGVNNSLKMGCDIDISNIALSGLNPGIDGLGNPLFGQVSRPATSAEITNPFIEFAIKGDSAATREVVGFRLGAENIIGLLTLGTENTENPTDGIRSFSGYMKMASTQGESLTKAATFGNSPDQSIQGQIDVNLSILGGQKQEIFTSRPGHEGNNGITVPAMRVNFNMPETVVSGQRINKAVVSGIRSTISSIPLASGGDMTNVIGSPNWGSDQLYVDFNPLVFGTVGTHAYFKMLPGSSLDNLNLNITFEQALSMIHNIPLNGTGGYLSLQSQPVKWGDSDIADTAQTGWWLSFKDPIQLGYLKTQDEVDISYVLPQVASAISHFLLLPENIIPVSFGEAIGAVLSVPVEKKLNIDVGPYTTATPATLTLQDKILQNQNVVPNCFGGHKFC